MKVCNNLLRSERQPDGVVNKMIRDDPLIEEEELNTMEGILERATEHNTYKQRPSDPTAVISVEHAQQGESRYSVRIDNGDSGFSTSYHKVKDSN